MTCRRAFLRSCSLAFALLFAGLPRVFAEAPPPRESVKVLTVGNSFALNATSRLPALAQAGGRSAKVFGANIGGASLERHVRHLRAHEANNEDPAGRPYTRRTDPRTGEIRDFSLREALRADTWDVVTIQQASGASYRPETYEPYAAELIAYIHLHAPQAEVVIIQTWAYRPDHPTLVAAGMTPTEMYERLRAAYHELSARHGLRIAPVGDAFHLAQRTPMWTLQAPDPNFDYQNPPAGAVPNEPGDLLLGWIWDKRKDGTTVFKLDGFHANAAGCYLGGAVLYEILFGADVTDVGYVDPKLTPEQCASLRRHAHDAVRAERMRSSLPTVAKGSG